MKVAGYGRVSTAGQAREGTSMEAQEEAIRAECEYRGYHLVRFYCDEGFSGKSIEHRPGLQQLLQDAKQGKFQVVMFTKLDRLGRNLRDLLNVWQLLQEECGLKLHCIEEPMVNTDSKLGKVMLQLLGAFAEFERETIRERTMAGRKKRWKEQKAIIGNLPYGYTWDEEKKEIVVVEEEAKVYERMVSMYVDEHLSFLRIAHRLSEEGVPTPSARKGWTRSRGAKWNLATVRNILVNPAYIGKMTYNKHKFKHKMAKISGNFYIGRSRELKPEEEWITIELPPLITEDRWRAIQKRIELNKNKPKKPYKGFEQRFLVDGLLWCAECGGKMYKLVQRNKTEEATLWYCCHWHRTPELELKLRGRKRCVMKNAYADWVDRNVLLKIVDVVSNPGEFFEAWVRDQNAEELERKCNQLKDRKAVLDAKLKRAVREVLEADDPEVQELFRTHLKRYKAELVEVEERLSRVLKEIDMFENRVERLKRFENFYQKIKDRKKGVGTILRTKHQFAQFLLSLPFSEQRRLVEAVIAPEEGGRVQLRYPRLSDVLSIDEVQKLSPEERNKPMLNSDPIVELVFTLDLNRIEKVISGLNRDSLLNKISINLFKLRLMPAILL